MQHHLVLRVAVSLLLPPLLLFACYVQTHGDYGPGGGFQAGALLAATLFLYGLVHGEPALRRALPPGLLRTGAAAGVLLYLGVGLAGLMAGGNFLDYGLLRPDPQAGRHLGVALVELGVGITVACVLTLLFQCFAAPAPHGARPAEQRTGAPGPPPPPTP